MKKKNHRIIYIVFFLVTIILISLFQLNQNNTSAEQLKKDNVIEEYVKNKDQLNYEKNKLVAKLKSISNEEINQLEEKYSVEIENITDDSYTITFNETEHTMDEMIDSLNSENVIEYAEPNYYFELAASPSTEPYFGDQWALNNSSYGIDLLPIWNNVSSNEEVVVAVVDTGIKYNHSEIDNNMWSNSGEIPGNAIDDDSNGYIDDYNGWNFPNDNNETMDTLGHGTHVAGIIGAEINDIGVAGTVSNVKLMAMKVISDDGYIYMDSIMEAVNYATNKGVKIFNFSFGSEASYSQTLKDLMESKDALFICAAGNGGDDQIGDDNDANPFYPSSYDLANIISVAATDPSGNLTSFSNYGNTSVDIAAPGLNILSSYSDGTYAYMSGTSMAAPFVTAAAAILYGADTGSTVAELKNNLLLGSKNLVSLSGKIATSGLLDIKESYNKFLEIVAFDGGDGSTSNPYLISSTRQFNAIRNDLAASYKLTSNIDLSDHIWEPIGTSSTPFTGTFDGSGYEITHLNINLPETNYIGLFGYVINSSATNPNMFNLKLTVDSIIGNSYIGSLIGYGENVNITDVYVKTNINTESSSTGYIGGIIGYADNSKISSSSTSGIIKGIGSHIGGLVGYMVGDITSSYNESEIYGNSYIGGIAGYITGNIQNVYNLGSITGDSTLTYAGGIVGYQLGNLNNSYYLGMLKVNQETLYTNVGLITGDSIGLATNSYFYNPYSIPNNGIGTEITLDNLYSSTSYLGFNFITDWEIGTTSLLPTLRNVDFTNLTDFTIPSDMTINVNDTSQYINITTNPTTNTRNNYLYSSQDSNIASIDIYGKIIPKNSGTTTINVYSIELNTTKTITINIIYLVKGDLNDDHSVTATDLIILRKYLAGLGTINSSLLVNADINNDSVISATDLVRVRRYLAGLEGM